jgi:uncharacterized protein YkwD
MKLRTSVVRVSAVLVLFGCSTPGADHWDGEGNVEGRATALDAPVELQSGIAVTGLSGATGDEKHFFIRVPEGATNLRLSLRGAATGSTGNADLYAREGAPATRATARYRSTSTGNNELIALNGTRSGTWYLLVRAQRAYTNVTVTASFTPPPGGIGGASGAGGTSGSAGGGGVAGSAGSNAGGSGGTSPTAPNCVDLAAWPAEWAAFEDRVLQLVNGHRAAGATCGGTVMPSVGPLTMESRLRVAARCHSQDMAINAYFDHTSLDGRSPWDRIAAAGYAPARSQGENIAAGYTSPEAVVSGWMTSPGHCTNIMRAQYLELGVGYAFLSGSPYRHYWTQDFGAR